MDIPKTRMLINLQEVLHFFGSDIFMRDIEGALSVAINHFIKDNSTYSFKKDTYEILIDKIFEDNRYIVYRVKSITNTYLEEIQYSYE